MANLKQKITWQLKKDDLKKLLKKAGSNYTALEFIMGITHDGSTKYYAKMVNETVGTIEAHKSANEDDDDDNEVQICPVPPDCHF